jgi:hypothetical protein
LYGQNKAHDDATEKVYIIHHSAPAMRSINHCIKKVKIKKN